MATDNIQETRVHLSKKNLGLPQMYSLLTDVMKLTLKLSLGVANRLLITFN